MVGIMSKLFGGNSSKKTIDPVCGMEVNPKNPAGGYTVHDGTRYFFCGKPCRVAFTADPASYLSDQQQVTA